MQKQPFPVGGGSKTFEDWGEGWLKNFRTGGPVTFAGRVSTPLHVMALCDNS